MRFSFFAGILIFLLLGAFCGNAGSTGEMPTVSRNSIDNTSLEIARFFIAASRNHFDSFEKSGLPQIAGFFSTWITRGTEAFISDGSGMTESADAAIYPPLRSELFDDRASASLGVPDVPDVPDVSDVSDVSDVPNAPSVPRVLNVPEVPDFPDTLSSLNAPDTLNVLLLDANLWLLPPPGAIGQGKRISDFVKIVRKSRPDIVTLQEVWLPSYVAALRNSLPEYYCIVKPLGLYNQTGLVIFSRFPPERAIFSQFHRTARHNLVELIARKGFLRARLRTSAGELDVIDTHLYAPSLPGEDSITRQQLEETLFRAQTASGPLILAGDLNLRVENVTPLTSGKFLLEENLGSSSVNDTPGKKIDYIMSKIQLDAVGKVISTVIREPVVSDHCPVLASVSFQLNNRGKRKDR